MDSSRNLYGTTTEGGSHGNGTVFKLVRGSNETFAESILYNFPSHQYSAGDAGSPNAGLLIDKFGCAVVRGKWFRCLDSDCKCLHGK